MKKTSPNIPCPCPCQSGLKYKKCCQKYHKGALPATALELMRSRYTAYALGLADYIIQTTHPDNSDYAKERSRWREEILAFSKTTAFEGLTIVDHTDTSPEAFVTFEAALSSGLLREKSRFVLLDRQWLYVDGTFS